MSYLPIPRYLELKQSPIHGMGIFVKFNCFLPEEVKNHNDHITHYIISNGENKQLIRTPLGGFINHSSKPNCTLTKQDITNNISLYRLTPLYNIMSGEEITLDYTKELCGVTSYKDEEWLNNTPKEISDLTREDINKFVEKYWHVINPPTIDYNQFNYVSEQVYNSILKMVEDNYKQKKNTT